MGLVAEFHSSSTGEDMNINVLILLIVASVVVEGSLAPRSLAPHALTRRWFAPGLAPRSAEAPEAKRSTKPVMNKWGVIKGCRCIPVYNYNPVCGTDGQTYNNKGALQCARKCGYDVDIEYEAACRS